MFKYEKLVFMFKVNQLSEQTEKMSPGLGLSAIFKFMRYMLPLRTIW